jgi:adenosylcobinamide-phosphate synthase
MILPPMPGAYGATDPLFLLLAALVLDAYVGDILGRLPKIPHPRALVVRVSGRLERRLNRPRRTRRRLMVIGALTAALVTLAFAAVGVGLAVLTRGVSLLWILELFLIASLISQRAAGTGALAVGRALEARQIGRARQALTSLAGELLDPDDIRRMAPHEVALSAVAGLGDRFASAVVAPTFWFVLLGLPGLLAQQALRSYATTVATSNRPGGGGYRRGTEGDFAFPAARLDAALDWIPDKLAGVILALAALFVPTAHPWMALKRLPKGQWWSIAAIGGALRLAARRDASPSGANAPGAHQVGRAMGVFTIGCLIHGGLMGGLLLLRQFGVAP